MGESPAQLERGFVSSQLSPESELLKQGETSASFVELALRSDNLDEVLTEACRLIGKAPGTHLVKVMELQGEDRPGRSQLPLM